MNVRIPDRVLEHWRFSFESIRLKDSLLQTLSLSLSLSLLKSFEYAKVISKSNESFQMINADTRVNAQIW